MRVPVAVVAQIRALRDGAGVVQRDRSLPLRVPDGCGAQKFDRVRKAYRFTVLLSLGMMSVLAAVIFVYSPQIVALFRREDPSVIEIGALAMRFQCAAMPLQTLIVPTNMLHQSTGKSAQATFLSLCRQGIFFVPLIMVLPRLFGLVGVQITQSVSDALTFLVSIPFAVRFFKKLGREPSA